jgi:hypothetical protein
MRVTLGGLQYSVTLMTEGQVSTKLCYIWVSGPPLASCSAGLHGGHGRPDSFVVMVGMVNGTIRVPAWQSALSNLHTNV